MAQAGDHAVESTQLLLEERLWLRHTAGSLDMRAYRNQKGVPKTNERDRARRTCRHAHAVTDIVMKRVITQRARKWHSSANRRIANQCPRKSARCGVAA
jgi:hypothetical protein